MIKIPSPAFKLSKEVTVLVCQIFFFEFTVCMSSKWMIDRSVLNKKCLSGNMETWKEYDSSNENLTFWGGIWIHVPKFVFVIYLHRNWV